MTQHHGDIACEGEPCFGDNMRHRRMQGPMAHHDGDIACEGEPPLLWFYISSMIATAHDTTCILITQQHDRQTSRRHASSNIREPRSFVLHCVCRPCHLATVYSVASVPLRVLAVPPGYGLYRG